MFIVIAVIDLEWPTLANQILIKILIIKFQLVNSKITPMIILIAIVLHLARLIID
jgi:hypothetical protein